MMSTRMLLAVSAVAAAAALLSVTAAGAPPSNSSVVITSPANGATVGPGIIRISGTYTRVYQVVISMNAEEIYDCHMDDPNGDDTGTWYFDLDAGGYDGPVEIIARGFDTSTRYFTWSAPITINVDNASANTPAVNILQP
ncbi:MAG: hypothetical protein ACM3X6_07275, partial [Patescibacteria group bacterium]